MWSAFQSLTPQDVVVVIGTSGMVLPVSEMALQFSGFKILNNLAPEPAIYDRAFDEVLHMPATKAAEKIDAILSGSGKAESGRLSARPRG
jgi:NAD-dependent deacetylase